MAWKNSLGNALTVSSIIPALSLRNPKDSDNGWIGETHISLILMKIYLPFGIS